MSDEESPLVAFMDQHNDELLWGSSTGGKDITPQYLQVPKELQTILDEKFDFQTQCSKYMWGNRKYVYKFCKMWINPKTRKLAELLYL